MSMRGIARSLSVSRMRLKVFIKKKKFRNLRPELWKQGNVRLLKRMRCGHLQCQRSIRYGFGLQLTVKHGRLPVWLSEIDLMRHVLNYGNLFPLITENVLLFIQIIGNHTEMFSRQNVCGSPGKKAGKQHILNVLTIHCVRDAPAWWGRHSPSAEAGRCTKNV